MFLHIRMCCTAYKSKTIIWFINLLLFNFVCFYLFYRHTYHKDKDDFFFQRHCIYIVHVYLILSTLIMKTYFSFNQFFSNILLPNTEFCLYYIIQNKFACISHSEQYVLQVRKLMCSIINWLPIVAKLVSIGPEYLTKSEIHRSSCSQQL